MSKKHPVVAVTGSSGAGTTTVKRAFEHIFFRDGIKPAVIEGDSFHRYSRVEMRVKMERMLRDAQESITKAIADIEVTHTIFYDNLKKEFTVTRSWKEDNPEVTKSFTEAKRWMTEINSLKIIPLNRLEKDEQYQLRVKAEVSKKTLPFYLHYILFFVSLWDFETDWYAIDFIY